MLFKKSQRHSSSSVIDARRRATRASAEHGTADASNHTRVARAFYCDALRGRQVWDTEAPAESCTLSFIVSGQRVDVSTAAPVDATPLILSVGNPQRLAERCWDAGYSVYVGDDATGATPVSVIDPFGRRIDLVP